jgi:hypothetical protein
MFAKVKSSVFIDSLKLELSSCTDLPVRGILRDEKGCICSEVELTGDKSNPELVWKGLNNLPYGIYTLELTKGEEEMKMRLVKRI